jgi:hypothetical protein
MYLFFILFLLINSINPCPLTDNYLSQCHCGILTNGQSYIKCDEQSLNQMPIFKRSFPYDELILSNNRIENLTHSSFDNIKTIRRINLENNSISFIDNDILRLLGNYLEELILTGNQQINSLEFLTRYPLKNLRILKLNKFNLSQMNIERLFRNMTKLEIVSLRSCQLKQIPNLPNLQILDLENNQISNSIYLSTSYIHLNLVDNLISSIILEKNMKLETLNLSKNNLKEFYLFSETNSNLKELNLNSNLLTSFDFSNLNDNLNNIYLNYNHLLSINLNDLPKKLISLSLNHNLIKQIQFPTKISSLLSLDLSYNQLKTIEKNILFEKLNSLNLQDNPLQCNCQLEWLKTLILSTKQFNTSTWTCVTPRRSFLSADFQCSSLKIPRIQTLNISYVKISSENGLFIRWSIIDEDQILDYIQISISDPFYLSPKISFNQTEVFLSNSIQSNKNYHICLILSYQYTRDKYCREFLTNQLLIILSNEINSIQTNQRFDMNLYMMLIGTCIGGLITFLLIFTCCYLCYQIHKYHLSKKNEKNVNLHYPIYHSNTCPYHHENLSNSTDSSHIDASLSNGNFKHIYQTIDNQDYSSLNADTQLFHLWNQSLRQKR